MGGRSYASSYRTKRLHSRDGETKPVIEKADLVKAQKFTRCTCDKVRGGEHELHCATRMDKP